MNDMNLTIYFIDKLAVHFVDNYKISLITMISVSFACSFDIDVVQHVITSRLHETFLPLM